MMLIVNTDYIIIFFIFSVTALECASCAYVFFDTGSDWMDTLLHQYFMDTECASSSVSHDVTVCNEGEVCMAMVFDVTGRVQTVGYGRH